MHLTTREITIAGLIAAIYAVLTVSLPVISYGIYQVRVAEALTVVPVVFGAAVPGLFIGCLVANIFGGNGWHDIAFGSLLTLMAAIFTHMIGRHYGRRSDSTMLYVLAPLPPLLLNAFGVAAYLAPLTGVGYWFAVQMIGIGEFIACYLMGIPLLLFLHRRKVF